MKTVMSIVAAKVPYPVFETRSAGKHSQIINPLSVGNPLNDRSISASCLYVLYSFTALDEATLAPGSVAADICPFFRL